jgi:glycosyltransferase involved in cell wall biosynthesis
VKTLLYIASSASAGGGGEVYLLSVFRHLDRSRFTPIVLLPGEGSLRAPLEALDVEVVVIESKYGWIKPTRAWYSFLAAYPGRVEQILALIQTRNIDLVHTNSSTRLEGALAARLAGVPNIHVAHTRFQPEQPLLQRFPLTREAYAQLLGDLSAHIVAVSRTVANELVPPLREQYVSVIHNGLDWREFDLAMAGADRLRAELGLAADSLLITAVGRIDAEKGFDTFIAAAGEIAARLPNTHFLLVGGGDDPVYERWLIELASSSSLSGRVHFLGYREDVPRIFAASDVFVLSSQFEGGPYVLVEAFAARCPAVATRCGGFVEEIVLPGQTGELVNVGDVAAMAAAIFAVVSNPERKAMGEAGRRLVQESFDAKTTVGELMAVYRRVLDMPRLAAGSPAVSLFLHGIKELSDLGAQVVAQEERLTRLEGETQFMRMRGIRHLWRSLRVWISRR